MLLDLQQHASTVNSIAGRWETVIEQLDDLNERLDDEIAPLLVEIRALTREIRARATVYSPAVFRGDDGALSSRSRALEYLTQKAAELKQAEAGSMPFSESAAREFAFREVVDAFTLLLRQGAKIC